ncbi:MAG: cell surface protein SprA [Bacteroidetes bacterium]|nr:MAG: cell surface protein SprA [Bacteroidota bacterium]
MEKPYRLISGIAGIAALLLLVFISCQKEESFEKAHASISLTDPKLWHIASTPQHQTSPDMFPEGALSNDLAFRFNSARFAWYIIDRLFTEVNELTPAHIANNPDQRSNHYERKVRNTEIWPDAESPRPIPLLNMAFYPNERGPYNFDVTSSQYSSGMAVDGTLNDPRTRWGGIMRAKTTTNLVQANISHIEFWLLDPFIYQPTHSGGDLYFNLGDVSEDVLRDGEKAFENGLPVGSLVIDVDTTIWGRVPTIQPIVRTFDNSSTSREYQDVGLNGLSSEDERSFYMENFMDKILAYFGENSEAFRLAWEDPAADDYQYFLGSQHDQIHAGILERYKRYNGLEGNSPTSDMSPEPYPTHSTLLPNTEDINQDGLLNETERYFQYRVSLRPEDMKIGNNFISEVREANVQLANGQTETVRWYQFQIPLDHHDRQTIGNINSFNDIRFMRIFLKGFSEPVFCRFATLELATGTE